MIIETLLRSTRRRRVVSLIVLAVAAIAWTGCAGPSSNRNQTGIASSADAARQFGACGSEEGAADFAPVDSFLGYAERWLEVTRVDQEASLHAVPTSGTTGEVAMSVAPYDTASQSFAITTQAEALVVHSSMLPGISWGLAQGARVYVALASKNLEREMVAYAIVEMPDGTHFFPGECNYEALTLPMERMLGSQYDSAVASIIGLTDAAQIAKVLTSSMANPAGSPTGSPVILNPEDSPLDLLRSLGRVTLALHLPLDWTGPYTVCSKIPVGWNDCISLTKGRVAVPLVNAYTDDSEIVAFWILDENATLTHPLQKVGVIDLHEVPSDVLNGKMGAVVSVGFRGDFVATSMPPVSGGSAKILDATTWLRVETNANVSIRVTGRDLTSSQGGAASQVP